MKTPLRLLTYAAYGLLGLLILLLAVIWGLAHGWARGPVERYASQMMERPVSLKGLKVYVLRTQPLVVVEGLRIANAPWTADAQPMVDLGDGKVALRLGSLLKGEVRLARLELNRAQVDLLREASGRANWSMGASKPVTGATPLQLPVIERFIVTDSRIKLEDAVSKIAFDASFSTDEDSSQEGVQPFHLSGRGELNKQPFRLDMSGGAVMDVLKDGTYPFSLDVHHGATTITAKGTFTNPLQFGDFKADMTLKGRNLADLYYLTGLALPSTRDYSLAGALSRAGTVYELNGLRGKLGGSDLNGDVRVELGGERPHLMADLNSKLLDPMDAGVVFGGSDGHESPYVLPDSPLDLTRLRAMDAEVRYRAAAVNVDTLPLKEVSMTVYLDQGKLTFNPLTVTLPQGTVSGSLVIDGSRDVPHLAADMRLVNARIDDFVAQAGQKGAASGPIVARVKLAGDGTSIHKAAAGANGTAAVVVPRGEIRKAFAELLGVNAANGLGLLLTGNRDQSTIRCGIASFEAEQGVMKVRHLTVDTDVTQLNGEGRLNLATEGLDLTLRGKPKEVRVLRLMVPVHIGGTLKNPAVGVEPVPLVVQAGAAVALGAVLTPLAAVLPFVDAGLTDDANCRGLMQDARSAGVKEPTTAPAR